MTAIVNRMATPGPLYKLLEGEIVQSKAIVAQHTRDRCCKIIQAVALSALFIIAAVAAFVVASIYFPNYAPIVLFVGAYLLIDKMAHCVRTHFRDKWKQLDKQIERIQAIAKRHLDISQNEAYQKDLAEKFQPADGEALKKYTYLAAHYEYCKEVADKALKAHTEKQGEAFKMRKDPTKQKEWIRLGVHAQQLREEGLEATVHAAFMRAIMTRPHCPLPPFRTFYAPIPLQDTDGDVTVNLPLFDSDWAINLLNRDLDPYQDKFFESVRDHAFSRTDVQDPDKFEAIVDAIVATIDELTASAG